MPPITSRDFQKAAGQRMIAAEYLLKEKLTLDAQYIGGYTVECSLKALILHLAPGGAKAEVYAQITRTAKMHRPEVLLAKLKEYGALLPAEIRNRMRRFNPTWGTELRYEVGRRDTGETRALLKTAMAIYDWVGGQLS